MNNLWLRRDLCGFNEIKVNGESCFWEEDASRSGWEWAHCGLWIGISAGNGKKGKPKI